jgi:tetratricopeptide (TPR) repeat protein
MWAGRGYNGIGEQVGEVMDAEQLYQDGVAAIRERNDLEAGRIALTRSLKLNPKNEKGWLWLSRTLDHDPQRQIQCIQHAIKLNPENPRSKAMLERLQAQTQAASIGADGELQHDFTVKKGIPEPTLDQKKQIALLMNRAEKLTAKDDHERALEQWVQVLEIKGDHEEALRNAVQTLGRLNFYDDAKELIQRAIDAGTDHPSVYLTAMDFAKHDKDPQRLEDLRQELALLPTADEGVLLKIAQDYINFKDFDKAQGMLERAIASHSKSQKLLLMMGEVKDQRGFPTEAAVYFNRAANIDPHTKEGKQADKKLGQSTPILTDNERGSVFIAVREAAAFGVVWLALAWQDVGLNLANIDGVHALGVLLSLAGGYLLITATSSPQQQPLAGLLGGVMPEKPRHAAFDRRGISGAYEEASEIPILPDAARIVLGAVGVILLVAAFWMVFGASIDLLRHPIEPDWFSLLEPE